MPTRPAGATRTPKTPKPPKPPKPPSPAQRQTQATTRLLNALAGNDKNAAITAALEAINERLEWDDVLQQRLRQNYAELAALSVPKPKQDQDLGPEPEVRHPSALVGHNPLAKLNPYQLDAAYEHDQLRRVLAPLGKDSLQEAVDVVLARNPGVKPPSRSVKQKMLDFIVEQVAGSGY